MLFTVEQISTVNGHEYRIHDHEGKVRPADWPDSVLCICTTWDVADAIRVALEEKYTNPEQTIYCLDRVIDQGKVRISLFKYHGRLEDEEWVLRSGGRLPKEAVYTDLEEAKKEYRSALEGQTRKLERELREAHNERRIPSIIDMDP